MPRSRIVRYPSTRTLFGRPLIAVAIGGLAIGGLAIGVIAIGGAAIGTMALGGFAVGEHAVSGLGEDPVAANFFNEWLAWLRHLFGTNE